MSTASVGPDFATFVRMYKQWEDARNQRLEGNPHPLPVSQHPINQVQCPIPQRLSPSRSRAQPYRQPPLRNPGDFSTFLQALDDVKKRQEEIIVALNTLQTMADQIKKTVDEGVATMFGTMERFEVIGRGVLEMALQPSDSQPSTVASSQPQGSNPPPHASHPPILSNPQKTYQGPNTTQPPAPFITSSNSAQPRFAPPASQAPESYPEQYLDYSGFEFLANDAS